MRQDMQKHQAQDKRAKASRKACRRESLHPCSRSVQSFKGRRCRAAPSRPRLQLQHRCRSPSASRSSEAAATAPHHSMHHRRKTHLQGERPRHEAGKGRGCCRPTTVRTARLGQPSLLAQMGNCISVDHGEAPLSCLRGGRAPHCAGSRGGAPAWHHTSKLRL